MNRIFILAAAFIVTMAPTIAGFMTEEAPQKTEISRKQVAFHGKLESPILRVDRIASGITNVYHYTITRAGKKAGIELQGNGSNHLDLAVYDSYGTLIGKKRNTGGTSIVEWTPSGTGQITIEITNSDNIHLDYLLASN
ncbi:MAG: hypothetical protein WCR46_10095 [Deltaproteobacteria bacterium]